MTRLSDDAFRIFISHKHEDHKLAMTVQEQLEKLIPVGSGDRVIECFVSGDDILAATDWNRKIKAEMARSHMLLLLFTNSSHKWDWCLYETGLFVKFKADEIQAIVCLYEDGGKPPGPLASVQCVPAVTSRIAKFLEDLCHETHQMSDDWHRGPLVKNPLPSDHFHQPAAAIAKSFERTLAGGQGFYHPCHRVVLDVGTAKQCVGIPRDAEVVTGEDHTSTYTMSLFGFAEARKKRTWGELLENLGAEQTGWSTDLDAAYAKGLAGELFTPVRSTFAAWDDLAGQRRCYKPILYEIARRTLDRKAVGVTIIFDRVDSD